MKFAGCLAIDMLYHDTMFAFSDLAHTLQERVNISVANGLKKVYIGQPYSVAFGAGDPVLIYRKYTGKAGKAAYKSVVTSYCIATRVEKIKARGQQLVPYSDFLHMVGNKSVFSPEELRTQYETMTNMTLIDLLYCGYFGAGNNVNWKWLKDNNCWLETHPMNFKYTREQFEKILREGNVDVNNIIID
jgi:hypothetical protein